MDPLHTAIQDCPIIDHHAHNLLLPTHLGSKSLLQATSEADGAALKDAASTLAHRRAIRQLASELGCRPTWEEVTAKVDAARALPDDAWAKRCFRGITTALIDDGLDRDTVHPVKWHDRLTSSPCKRIVRIEVVAQDILKAVMKKGRSPSPFRDACREFQVAMRVALNDPDVAGFKSIICYRSGLQVPVMLRPDVDSLDRRVASAPDLERLKDDLLNPAFVNVAAQCIQDHGGHRKPFQFHTGLGDNDLQLQFSSAAHLQPLISAYPDVPFVLLHASYPFTREAGYLASVYKNCYLDIGEVFPMVSQDGQEQVVRQALELCPSEKLCWSTDGHWFPETYLLAVCQIRQALKKVLTDYQKTYAFTTNEAIKCARDILYNTSNRLYRLKLPLAEATPPPVTISPFVVNDDLSTFEAFLRQYPAVRFLHLQFLDYTAMRRGRVIPVKRALDILSGARPEVGIQRGIFRMLQNDSMAPGTVHQGEWTLKLCLDSLRPTEQPDMASIQVEIRHDSGAELSHDPRTVLRRILHEAASKHGARFTVGFEIEVVFVKPTSASEGMAFTPADLSYGHLWSGAASLESTAAKALIRDVLAALDAAGVELEQYHSEGAKSQYEFILSPLPALAAADNLVAARAAIVSAADAHGLRATLVPKVPGQGFGTGAHIHLSMEPEDRHESFYAGVLSHMRGILAFAMSSLASYDRMGDGLWSGGTWVCWGHQNRETCLRRVKGSHWECKIVDGLAHPYLTLAAMFGAGLDGIKRKAALPTGNVEVNTETLSPAQRKSLGVKDRLPSSLAGSIEALLADGYLSTVLGAETVKTFVDVKRAEVALLESMEPVSRANWLIARY